MQPAYRVATVRAAEEPLLAERPGELMQKAAFGLACAVLEELSARRGGGYAARVLLAVGPGNNGGDALYAGVTLLARGVRVLAWRTAGSAHAEAWAAFVAAGGRGVDAAGALDALAHADLVLDGVLGIGGRPGLAAEVAGFARACRAATVPVVAVDLPSGLDADAPNAQPADGFVADLTVTFGGLKYCHVLEPARSRCGRVRLVDIGLGLREPDLLCWTEADVAASWPLPDATSDKYSRGVVGIDAGSAQYTGAGVLATLGAVHAGAGMVRFTGDPAVASLVRQAAPNVVVGAGRVQAMVFGPGWGSETAREYRRRISDAIAQGLPTVIDADGLLWLPPGPLGPQVLLTPHAGELARLQGRDRAEVVSDPIGAVRRTSETLGCAVLLKGATQYLAEPGDSLVSIAVPGPSWTAQAGSGDVLAGICGALLAAGLPTGTAALAAAGVQALAAASAGPLPPQRVAVELSAVIARLAAGRLLCRKGA